MGVHPCGVLYKRHSKSIDPERHTCGSCKSKLVQTKPVPRAAASSSEYQKFMKEQMKVLKKEQPSSSQPGHHEARRGQVGQAGRAAETGGRPGRPGSGIRLDAAVRQFIDLTLEDTA